MEDQYYIVADESTIEIKVKSSRFIGESCLVPSIDEALLRLEQIRKREHAATHHCFAYRIGLGQEMVFKYSDDGEPSGTAGKPIFDCIVGADLTNTLVVVTRYFGGTKLGTGGLAHAYGDAAKLVLDRSGRVERFVLAYFKLDLDFGYFDKWQKILVKLGATTTSSNFSESVSMEIAVRRSRAEELRNQFVELTSGKGLIAEIRR